MNTNIFKNVMPVLLNWSVSFPHVKNGDYNTKTKSLHPGIRQGIMSTHFKAASIPQEIQTDVLFIFCTVPPSRL